jgi:hypothetical protein
MGSDIKINLPFQRKNYFWLLFFGIGWIILGITSILQNDALHWTDYGRVIMGLIHLGLWVNFRYNSYINIQDGTLYKRKFFVFSSSMRLREVTRIKEVRETITLVSDNKKLQINKSFLSDDSIAILGREVNRLDLPLHLTPFGDQDLRKVK